MQAQAAVTEQFEFLLEKVGLTISQLADLLKVGHQSIYKWRDEMPDISKEELSRLGDLYKVFISMSDQLSEKLGPYVYRKIGNQPSLYNLLMADTIDIEKAKNAAIKINGLLLEAIERTEQRRKKLQEAGLKPVNKKQKEKALNEKDTALSD